MEYNFAKKRKQKLSMTESQDNYAKWINQTHPIHQKHTHKKDKGKDKNVLYGSMYIQF